MERVPRILRDCALSAACAIPVAVLAQPAATNGKAAPANPLAGVGFRTVAAALAALKSRPGAKLTVSQPDAWTIVTEQGGSIVWSFTPAGHPAHPAVVRRSIEAGGGGEPRIDMAVLCEGDKPSCDRLAKDFREINERSLRPLRERIKNADESKQP